MRRTNPRVLRWALLGILVAVAAAIFLTLRRPPAAAPKAAATAPIASSGTTADDLVYRKIVDGKERYVVKAKAMLGQEKEGTRLKGVEASFPHVYEGKEEMTVIRADDCVYDAEKQRAVFTGKVKVNTTEGLELRTESLVYNGVKALARSDEHVEFQHGPASGSSTGMLYQADGGSLTLDKDVFIRIEREGRPATEIRGDTASASKTEAVIRLAGNVVITEGSDQIKAQKLTLNMTPDFAFVLRALFLEDTELRTGARSSTASGESPAGSFAGQTTRLLRSRKLDVWFHENSKEVREAVAVPDATLAIGAGPRSDRYALAARTITFRFDPQGRLVEVVGQQGVELRTAPPAGKGAARTVKCALMVGRTDPASGEIVESHFTGGVEIVEGPRKATAREARYEDATRSLFLSGDSRVADPGQGSDLAADAIDLLGNGNLKARDNVRHDVVPKSRAGVISTRGPWQLTSRTLDYEAASRTGRYEGSALLRAGDDEVRADALVLEEPKAGQRRLRGNGNVISILHSRGNAKDGPTTARKDPVETRSATLDYQEEKRQVVYTGEVRIRQGDITTRSPEATAYLDADGSRIETIVAGEGVEVQQGPRHAKGTRGTYTPADETMLLVGDKVTLEEGTKRRLQGRSLTFHARDDRILVDGREVERTESVFRREPARP